MPYMRQALSSSFRLSLLTLVLISSSHAQETSGPFGVRAGMTRRQVEQIIGAKAFVEQNGDDVVYSTAPQSHPDFDSYTLTFSRAYGLVRLTAMSRDINDGESGQSTSSKCQEILYALTEKYGKPQKESKCQIDPDVAVIVYWGPLERPDRVTGVGVSATITAIVTNRNGKKVLAGAHEKAEQWLGRIMVDYFFEDWDK